jgi:hypothetical protein
MGEPKQCFTCTLVITKMQRATLRRKAVATALRTQQQPANFASVEKTLPNSSDALLPG